LPLLFLGESQDIDLRPSNAAPSTFILNPGRATMSIRSVLVATAVLCVNASYAQAPQTPATESAGAIRERELLQRFPAPGKFIDVGGRKLHLYCKGDAKGPAVIIEGGALVSGLSYMKAQDAVAPLAKVCVYDRAGMGWSDAAPTPRSLEARADDLHALLAKSGLKAPYILIGHSAGGMMVRVFAHKYPKQVAAMILVEASEEQFNTTPESLTRLKQTATQLGFAVNMANAGQDIPQLRVPNGPPEQDLMQRVSAIKAGQDDFVAMSNLPTELAKFGGLGKLGDTPLVVIRRGKADPGFTEAQNQQWNEAQARLATLSTRSVAMVAENSGHVVNLDQPEMFATAVRRVQQMLNTAR
jgi:pimeloyl-ACP methyl ester carboxylesterase